MGNHRDINEKVRLLFAPKEEKTTKPKKLKPHQMFVMKKGKKRKRKIRKK